MGGHTTITDYQDQTRGGKAAVAMRQLSVSDPCLAVALGLVPGATAIHKFGRNPDIPNAVGTFEAIWNGGGDYTGHNPIVAQILEVFSGSGNDVGTLLSSGTATGGSATTLIDTGATFSTDTVAVGDIVLNDTQSDNGIVTAVTETTLTFLRMDDGTTFASTDAYRVVTQASTGAPVCELYHLLDGTFTSQPNEYIILNGATPVSTVGTYIRQSRAHCHGGANAGALTCRQKTTTANIMMVMPIGYSSTMICAYTVPAGKKAFVTDWYASLSGKTGANCNVRLMMRPVNDTYQVKEEFSIMAAGSSSVTRKYSVPKSGIPEMTDIKIMADSDTNSTGVAAGFDLILIDA